MNSDFTLQLNPTNHQRYFEYILNELPAAMSSLDSNRVVIAYFAIAGLDVLRVLPDQMPQKQKNAIIEWVYTLQVVDETELTSGFQICSSANTLDNKNQNAPYKWGHIAATYAALGILLSLGDDLSRVNKSAIIKSLKQLQLPSGCFKGAKEGTENDMRFVFCAAAISYILNDWSGIDIDLMVKFILDSISYDFGIAQGPHLESHSGSTYCAIAALSLSKQLHRLTQMQKKGLIRWLLNRLDFGFSGRPNKPVDTCYSFWTGATLKILNAYNYIHRKDNNQFVLVTQGRRGGFSKWANCEPDPMHTYLGLAGLSFMEEEGLNLVVPDLNLTERCHEHLLRIHDTWQK